MSTPSAREGLQAAGINSILPKEQSSQAFNLPIIKNTTDKDSVSIGSNHCIFFFFLFVGWWVSWKNLLGEMGWKSRLSDRNKLEKMSVCTEKIFVIKTCYRPKYIMQALTKIYRLPQHKNKSQSCWFHGGKITGIWKRLLCLHIRNCQMIAPLYMWVNPWKVRKFGTTYLPLHICLHGVIYVLYTIMNNLIWFEYFNPIG